MEPGPLPVGDLLTDATGQLRVVDAADTAAVLLAAWQGFAAAGAAGELLAACADPEEYRPLWENAAPVLAAAPSLPRSLLPEVRLAGGSEDRLDDAAAAGIRAQILDLALALNSALPAAAGHAGEEADRRACQAGTVLSSELGDCYEARPDHPAKKQRLASRPGNEGSGGASTSMGSAAGGRIRAFGQRWQPGPGMLGPVPPSVYSWRPRTPVDTAPADLGETAEDELGGDLEDEDELRRPLGL